jgi:hypothetical protein
MYLCVDGCFLFITPVPGTQICGQHQPTLVQADHEHGAEKASQKSKGNQENSRRNQGTTNIAFLIEIKVNKMHCISH